MLCIGWVLRYKDERVSLAAYTVLPMECVHSIPDSRSRQRLVFSL